MQQHVATMVLICCSVVLCERADAEKDMTESTRADTQRTIKAIMVAAERVLSRNPAATMEDIAEAAGVARTTVHRRFATREVLVEALGQWAARQFDAAIDTARADTSPPLIALYQVTANVLDVKIDWGFALSGQSADPSSTGGTHESVAFRCRELFRRAKLAGLLREDIDLEWARRVYYALIHEAAVDLRSRSGADSATAATLVVDTLLRGMGAPGVSLSGPVPVER